MKNITKTYHKDDLTVKWEPHKCIHSGICFMGLPKVFDPRRKPWVDMEAGLRDDIIRQVKACPSKALSFEADQKV
jgi:uncharacterized Fe-S cluster protein YjdI